MIHLLHILIIEWHHHAIVARLAVRYLHERYPGMPRHWYAAYLRYMENHNIGPRDW